MMARKSRKNLADAASITTVECITYRAGAYLRLSTDDTKKRGDSIETQRNIIENFVAAEPDIQIAEIYTDINTTGTNFERPGFKKMLADIECGRINCIIVKDLTRFGRNAIDAGYYIEKYLPTLGVRFIAVTDSYDSLDGDGGIMLALKNIISESYALDISRKCKAVQRQNIADGRFIGRLAPYGYQKALDDCHKLIPDPDTAPVVVQIFKWAGSGVTAGEITRRLSANGIPSPSHYNYAKGFNASEKLLGTKYWKINKVHDILADRVYVGDMVQGKSRTVNGRKIQVDPSEWVCVPNTHAPIVSRDVFDRVQLIRQNVYDNAMEIQKGIVPYTPNVFRGKVLCATCGYPMKRKRQNKDGTYWFRCESQVKYAVDACTVVSVKESELKEAILSMLHKQSEVILGRYVSIERAITAPDTREAELREINQELDRIGRLKLSLYESMVSDLITQMEYLQMKGDYEEKIEVLSKQADEIRNRRYETKSYAAEYTNYADAVSATLCDNDMTAEIIDRLVQEIRVRPDKSFDVVLRYRDEFEKGGLKVG